MNELSDLSHMKYDCIVVGAGLSGLTCAARLRRCGVRVLVLEARQRIGGRSYSVPLYDESGEELSETIDKGGAWLGKTQRRALRMAGELGCELAEQYVSGRNRLQIDTSVYEYRGDTPYRMGIPLLSAQLAVWRLESMACQVPLDTPWTASRATEWDRQTVGAWIQRHVPSRHGRELIRVAIAGVFLADMDSISLLWFLFYVRSAGSLRALIDTKGGAQEYRFVGGSQSLSLALEKQVTDAHGKGPRGNVLCGERVLHVDADAEGAEDGNVHVRTGDGNVYSAPTCVMAVSPQLLGSQIRVSPPCERSRLGVRMVSGTGVKFFVTYASAWWRERDLSGLIAGNGDIVWIFDNTPSTGRVGVLIGVFRPNSLLLRDGVSRDDRRTFVLKYLVDHYGSEAADNLAYDEQDWSREEFTDGCVNAMVPGTLVGIGSTLRAPCGNVCWAGTETAYVWNGYLDGAIEAGDNAAYYVLQTLRDQSEVQQTISTDARRLQEDWQATQKVVNARRPGALRVMFGQIQHILEISAGVRVPILVYFFLTCLYKPVAAYEALPFIAATWILCELTRIVLLSL